MNLELGILNSNIIGRTLGQNIYSPKGVLLLAKGTKITSFHYSHFKDLGYKSIYLQHPNTSDPGLDSQLIDERFRAKAPSTLKRIIYKLYSDDMYSIAAAKRGLNALAQNIIANIDETKLKLDNILEPKRLDDYIFQHALNVAIYSNLIGKSLDYHYLKLLDLTLASLLYDIGMIGLDTSILNKNTQLEKEELEHIKAHTIQGFQHLGRHCSFNGLVTVSAIQHHERYDGEGYPKGIAGKNIHEYSRIITLVDVFDAYTSDRPHRQSRSIEEAIDYMKLSAGKVFDPKILSHFLNFLK